MTVQQIQAMRDELAKSVSNLVQAFEAATGAFVHSIPVIRPETPTGKTTVHIKVQL